MVSKVFKVEISPFYIRADNTDEMIDILWQKYGIPLLQIERTTISKDMEFAR